MVTTVTPYADPRHADGTRVYLVLGHTQLKTGQQYSHPSNETLLAAVDASANAAGTHWGAAQTAKAGENLALVEA